MSYAPAAVLTPEAGGGAEPEVDLLAVRLGPGHVLQAIGVADVAADSYLQILGSRNDWSLPGGEPFVVPRGIAGCFGTDPQRRREIKRNNVLCKRRDRAGCILIVNRPSELIEQSGICGLPRQSRRAARDRFRP